jgi:hypothetical protein
MKLARTTVTRAHGRHAVASPVFVSLLLRFPAALSALEKSSMVVFGQTLIRM